MARASDFERDLIATMPNLRGYARGLAKNNDRASDLVQETMARAWAKQTSFTPGTNLKAWLFTILRNEFYNQLRRRGPEVQDPDGLLTASLAVPPSQESALELQELRNILPRLSRQQREVILLVGLAGHTYADAAGFCNCAPGTLKSRLSRARARLRGMINGPAENNDLHIHCTHEPH